MQTLTIHQKKVTHFLVIAKASFLLQLLPDKFLLPANLLL
jgi:hypothetical protein